MISKQILDEIRQKTDIVTVISEFVRLKKSGKNYTGPCPFHSEKKPSFTVSPDKQLFHCFGCGEGGNVFSFLMKAENISFAEAAQELGGRVGVLVEKIAVGGASRGEREKLYEVMNLAVKFFAQALQGENGQAARRYLEERGVNSATVKAFELGFAPEGWDHLFKHLIARGASPQVIEKAGLILPRENQDGYYDRFRQRLMFPIFDARGRAIAFSGRALGEAEPKYLNSPDTPIFKKGDTIYGLHLAKEAIRAEKKAVLVEGNLDLISAHQAGINNTVAPLGTALTLLQCRLLARYAENAVLAFDSDPAGSAAAEKSIELLRGQGLDVKVAVISGAKDPDELIKNKGAEAFRQSIDSALPYLEFKIRRALGRHNLSEIESRSRALREVAVILNDERDQFVQREYARLAAQPLRVDPEAILAEAKRLNFYSNGKISDLRRITQKPASRSAEAEKILIALAVGDNLLREELRQTFRPDDFSTPEIRKIADWLFRVEAADNCAHYILENLASEEDRQFFSAIMLEEEVGDPRSVFSDCIQTMKNELSHQKIEKIREELRRAEAAGEAEKAVQLLEHLKHEIS